MPALLALIERLLGVMLQVFGIAQLVNANTRDSAEEHTPFLIEGIVTTAGLTLANPTYGLAALESDIQGVALLIATARSDILAAIAGITFPPTPPAGWVTGLANGVWDYQDPTANGTPQGPLLVNAGAFAANVGNQAGFPFPNAPGFLLTGPYFANGGQPYYDPPLPDWSDILESDSRLSWLTRTDPGHTWWISYLTGDPYYQVSAPVPAGNWYGHPAFTEADFQVWKAARRRNQLPIWPGDAYVTLGTPVALSSNLTVAGPLDGVLVNVTTPPSGLGKFAIGGLTAYYRIGQIAFITDHGEAEPWQYLSWDQGVYCPKAQARAASAILSVLAGAGGTATPWLAT